MMQSDGYLGCSLQCGAGFARTMTTLMKASLMSPSFFLKSKIVPISPNYCLVFVAPAFFKCQEKLFCISTSGDPSLWSWARSFASLHTQEFGLQHIYCLRLFHHFLWPVPIAY